MCGILGPKSTNGSLFMQEKMYQNFMLGLQTMSTLGEDSALDVSAPPRASGRDEGTLSCADGTRQEEWERCGPRGIHCGQLFLENSVLQDALFDLAPRERTDASGAIFRATRHATASRLPRAA